jgi:hypothetical protein
LQSGSGYNFCLKHEIDCLETRHYLSDFPSLVRAISVISRKQQKLFEPLTAYGCRFGEQTKIAFIIVCPYQRAHPFDRILLMFTW